MTFVFPYDLTVHTFVNRGRYRCVCTTDLEAKRRCAIWYIQNRNIRENEIKAVCHLSTSIMTVTVTQTLRRI